MHIIVKEFLVLFYEVASKTQALLLHFALGLSYSVEKLVVEVKIMVVMMVLDRN